MFSVLLLEDGALDLFYVSVLAWMDDGAFDLGFAS